jgi:hypothetical protein
LPCITVDETPSFNGKGIAKKKTTTECFLYIPEKEESGKKTS